MQGMQGIREGLRQRAVWLPAAALRFFPPASEEAQSCKRSPRPSSHPLHPLHPRLLPTMSDSAFPLPHYASCG